MNNELLTKLFRETDATKYREILNELITATNNAPQDWLDELDDALETARSYHKNCDRASYDAEEDVSLCELHKADEATLNKAKAAAYDAFWLHDRAARLYDDIYELRTSVGYMLERAAEEAFLS